MSFSDDDLERYARHIVLREIGGPGQQRLRRARVAMIGAGGLGAPALLYLAAAGVGAIRVIDDDVVALSNLQRQVLFTVEDVDRPKVDAAAARLRALNPGVEIQPEIARLTAETADALLSDVDLIIDGSDNFATRRLANAEAVRRRLPLVFGAIGQWEGQVALFHRAAGGACYACLFPNDPAPGAAPSCAEAGVLGALAGVVGSMMAVEAVKFIVGSGEPLADRLLLYDALSAETRVIRLARRADCAVCADAD